MKHTYREKGRFTVKVTLDDLTSTTVTRTFFLNSLDLCIPPTSSPLGNQSNNIVSAGPFFSGDDLLFSVATASCNQQQGTSVGEVHALNGCASVPTIDPLTGAMNFSNVCSCDCFRVTANNSCGTSSQVFYWCD